LRAYLWRPTRPFQTGNSEKGQLLIGQDPAMALNFPREYQWSGHDSWRLPSYLEITNSFQPGKNVVTIEVESRAAPARVCFHGEIQMHDGTVIPISSDETWSAEPAVPGIQKSDWTEPGFRDLHWRHAVTTDGPKESAWRSVPESVFTKAFAGSWIRHPNANNDAAVDFAATWDFERRPDEAWIRLLTNRNYELHINGQRVRVASTKPPDLDNGEWVFGRASAFDPSAKPELLDPDEVGSSFVGSRFESPRKGHRNLGEFRNPYSPKLTPFRYIRTYNRAQAPGEWDPKRTLAESRRTPETPDLFPERPRPNALKRDSLVGGYLSYSVANLLRPGPNRIEVRCLEKANANWPTQIALDGGAVLQGGKKVRFVEDSDWEVASTSRFPTETGPIVTDVLAAERPVHVAGVAQAAKILGPVLVSGKSIPSMQYRGTALGNQQLDRLLPQSLLQVGSVTIVAIMIFLSAALLVQRRSNAGTVPLWFSTCRMLYAMLLTATVTIGAGLLLECSWVERHEVIWSINGSLWRVIFPIAINCLTLGFGFTFAFGFCCWASSYEPINLTYNRLTMTSTLRLKRLWRSLKLACPVLYPTMFTTLAARCSTI